MRNIRATLIIRVEHVGSGYQSKREQTYTYLLGRDSLPGDKSSEQDLYHMQ